MSFIQWWLMGFLVLVAMYILAIVTEMVASPGRRMRTFADWFLLTFGLLAITLGLSIPYAIVRCIVTWSVAWMLP